MADGRHLEKIEKLQYLNNHFADLDDLSVIRRVSVQGCAFCGYRHCHYQFRGSNFPKTPFWGVNRHFLAKMAKKLAYYQNYLVVSTQLCTTIKTTKFSLWWSKYAFHKFKMADGRHLEKIKKLRYLCNHLTDFDYL